MITKVPFTNFKGFRKAEIHFGSLSILVGANATGKSNVRDGLRFLHGIARGYSLAEVIGEKYGEGGQLQWSGIRGGTREAARSGEKSFSVGVEFARRVRPFAALPFSYKIEVMCGANGAAPRVLREKLYRGSSMVFDSHPKNKAPEQTDRMHLAVRLRSGGNWRKLGPKLVGLSNQPLLTQVLELENRQDLLAKMKRHVETVLQELESIRFIDFSPELMRKPSIPGQLVLSDRGDNLSSVLQAVCEKLELKRALSHWIQELTPMDVTDFEFVPDAAGKILVHLVEQGGMRISANSASDGTLRFLGMLAALLGPRPAKFYFFEEIDNGIHPARLSLLMDLLASYSEKKGIQIVATTHSPQVLRLIRSENLKYATLAYRLKGDSRAYLKPLPEIPHLMEIIKSKDIARLHESSWLEQTMQFSEGAPELFPLEEEAGQ